MPIANILLHDASTKGDLERVKHIVSTGAVDVNIRGFYGLTPLMLAAQNGHYDVFGYLNSKGADLTLVDRDGDHILSMACVGNNMDIVKYVVSKEPTLINKRRNDGRTALMWAAWHGKKTVFDYLLKEDADSSLVDDDGYNMLHCACFGGDTGMMNDAITKTSIDINSSDIYGWTAVMVAAACGYKDMVDLLFEKESDLSHIDKMGNNILHVACRGGHVKIVEHILSQEDIDVNCRGQYGGTPLMISAFDGHRELFDLLVTKGADATLVCNKGNTILHVACIGGHVEMVKHIMSQGIGDVNSQNQDGTTPLKSEEQQGCGETLLSPGVDLSQVNNKGNNVLHLACEIGSMEIVQHVVSQDSLDINAKNSKGETATVVAKRKHHMDLYEWLVSQGGHVVSKSYKH
ncbi:ankyrin repeat domain-containing protein 50-like [Haliotis cracherodii]|uniref:ankyrin repeat domain-containing protein 50-like n=1 Tax=Haliotis cracherodii TaxID=6455 RepID=UPI0039EB0EA3